MSNNIAEYVVACFIAYKTVKKWRIYLNVQRFHVIH